MKKIKNCFLFSFMILFIPSALFSQYAVNGSGIQNTCKCFTLTQPISVEEASVWDTTMIDLNSSFDFSFKVFLGCKNSPGADGIVFVLQQQGLNVIGGGGSGLGYSGLIGQSIGIEIDTWQTGSNNPPVPWGDPPYDHIGIQKNGNCDHLNSAEVIATPVQASANSADIEDCQWHAFRVSWDASGKWLRVYFDNALRIETQYDLLANVFSNSPMVYWGFTGATGGEFNLQQFCIESTIGVHANFTTNALNNTVCYGTPVTFLDSSWYTANIQSYYWDFGDGSTSTLQNPISHTYTTPGIYVVKHIVKGNDGCLIDTISKSIFVRQAMAFAGNDTVTIKDIPLQLTGTGGIIYSWSPSIGLNNPFIQNPIALLQNDIRYLLTVTTTEGCVDTDEISIKVFNEIAIYIPTAFTPNNDALNDILKPTYIGIRKLSYFRIFNRWGQLVFSTNDMSKGWDGHVNGFRQQTGVYVWMIKAEDIAGKVHELKGTSTIIR